MTSHKGAIGFVLSAASTLLCLFILPASAQFRSGIDLVHFSVTVLDRKGNLIRGLIADDFEIYEDGKRQKVSYFAGDGAEASERPPLHLGLLFDTSGSMSEDLGFARSAAVKFLNALPDALDITLVDFDTEVRVARYGQADFPRLVERIRARAPDGWTALYDALGVYLNGAAEQDGQKVLVMYTDGGDTRSSMTFHDTLKLLRASDVTLYAIGFLEHQSSSARNEQRLRLEQLAAATGGFALFPLSVKRLDEMYDRILEELAARYSLGYHSSDARTNGAWRKVEIKLARPELRGVKLRTRNGYFAPFKQDSR